jgi:hypothetical protein
MRKTLSVIIHYLIITRCYCIKIYYPKLSSCQETNFLAFQILKIVLSIEIYEYILVWIKMLNVKEARQGRKLVSEVMQINF